MSSNVIRPPKGFHLVVGRPPIPGHWSERLGAADGIWLGDDNRYRILLWRTFDDYAAHAATSWRRPAAFGMVNPSTADAFNPDPSVTRCLGFSRREQSGGTIVANVSPWRTTYPRELYAAYRRGEDVFKLEANLIAWQTASRLSRQFIMAWGGSVRGWMRPTIERLLSDGVSGHQPLCLGVTAAGEPRHPLMLRSDTPLRHWEARR